MKDTGYINVQGWMINRLPIKGNELMLFALIFGFSQDGETKYKGSISYIQKSLKLKSRTSAINLIKSLIKKDLIHKYNLGGINHYKPNLKQVDCFIASTKSVPVASTKSVPVASTKSVPITNKYTYKDNNKEKKKKSIPKIKIENDLFIKVKILNDKEKLVSLKNKIGTPQYKLLNEACKCVDTYETLRGFWNDGRFSLFSDFLEYKRSVKKQYKTSRGVKASINMFSKYNSMELLKAYKEMILNEWNTIHPKKQNTAYLDKKDAKQERLKATAFGKIKKVI